MNTDGGLLEVACTKIAELDVPAYVKDSELRYVAVNPAYARFFQRATDDFVGKTSLELFGRLEDADCEDRERRAIVFGEEQAALCFDPFSSERYALAVERFVTEDELVFLFGVFNEAPAGRPAAREHAVVPPVAPPQDLYASVISELPAPTFIRAADHRMVFVNQAYCDLIDLDSSALLGKTEIESFGEAGRMLHDDNQRIIDSGTPSEVEEVFSRGPGTGVPVISRRSRITNSAGEHFVLGSLSDISALKEREAQFAAAQQEATDLHTHVESILRSLPVGVLILDQDFNIEYVNDSFYSMWNVDKPFDLIGWSYYGFIAYNFRLGIYGPGFSSAEEVYSDRIRLITDEENSTWQTASADGRPLAVSCRRLDTGKYLVTFSDISALHAREQETMLYRAAIEQVPVPVFLRDEQHKLVFANAAYEKMLGGKRERFIGLTEEEMFPDRAEQFRCENEKVLADGQALEKAQEFALEDDRVVAAITRLDRIVTPDNSRYIVGTITDVSALKVRERQLVSAQAEAEKLNAYLEGIMRTMPVGVAILDQDLKVEFANNKVHEIWDWPEGAVIEGRSFREFSKTNYDRGWTWKTEESFEENYAKRVEELRGLEGAVQRELSAADGKLVVVTSKRLIDGKILITYSNMSEIRQRDLEISEARAQLEQLGQLMKDSTRVMSQGLAVVEDGVIIQSNDALARILSVPSETVAAGQSWHVCFAHCAKRGDFGGDPMAVLKDWQQKIASLQGFSTTFRAAEQTWVQMEAVATAQGHWMVVCTDITEMKQREEELTALLARAEAADKAKSEFLANMSHEIRTPMNGVLGMAELLSKSLLDTRQKTFVDIIVKSGNALLTIINDILDFSKIDAGQLTLRKAPFDPVEAIEDVATLLSTSAAEKDIELIVRGDATVRHMLTGDAGRFRQIVTNLVGNAVKFTEKGHVLIELSGESMESGRLMLTIRIEDTGIGIPESKRRSIFEKFSQVDASSTRRHEGTGLGLAITSGLVELFGGYIDVESELGKGSVFTVNLPFSISSERHRQNPVPVIVQDARILVVDDNAVNRQILTEQLSLWGFDGVAVESGTAALAILDEAVRIGLQIDALVVDYHMPEMNGIDFARLVRQDRRYDAIAIIFLTSMDMVGDERIFEELKVQAHLMKPARANLLRGAIVDVVRAGRLRRNGGTAPAPAPQPAAVSEPVSSRKPSRERQEPATEAKRPSGLDVLIAEDNEVNQIVFTQILEATGLNFRIVGNGREAVEAWEELNPRLVLMDVSMPVMNGHQATKAIRELEQKSGRASRVPIIGVTAHALESDRELCLEAGMDDYLAKPISPELLGQKMGQWLDDLPVSRTSFSGSGT